MKELHSSPEKSAAKGSIFLSSISLSVALIIFFALCLTGVTWAWFTASTAVKTVDIVTANYKAEVAVTDQDGNAVEPVDGKYTLDKNTRYTVTITASGTASTGFATFSVDDIDFDENGETDVFHTVQIAPGETIFFDILGYTLLDNVEGNWATSSSPEIVLNDPKDVNPVFEGDPRFVKLPVKLVPVDEDSTAMIERDGVVETWNSDLEATPYGVSKIIEPNEYAYSADSFDTYYVYGLKANITEDEIADYVKASGNGRIEIELNSKDKVGTGAIIKVIDNADDSLVEQFYIVIFGDLDGDTDISAQDSSRLKLETRTKEWSDSSKDAYIAYLVKAADLDLDGDISAQDSARIESTTRNTITIDQKTGKAS